MSEIKSLDDLVQWLKAEADKYENYPEGTTGSCVCETYRRAWWEAKGLLKYLDANPPAAGPWQTGKPPREEAYLAWYHDCGHTNSGYPLVNDTYHIRPYPDLWAKVNPPTEADPAKGVDHDANSNEPEMITPEEEEPTYTWREAFLAAWDKIEVVEGFARAGGNLAAADALRWAANMIENERHEVDE
jgi:hypothetical protein